MGLETYKNRNLVGKLVEDQESLGLSEAVRAIRLGVRNKVIPEGPGNGRETREHVREERRSDLGSLLGHEVIQRSLVDIQDGLGKIRARGRGCRSVVKESPSDEHAT